jgi:hypothetical protein
MADGEQFECAKCKALYKVVRVSSGPEVVNQLIHCRICKQPMAPTCDGKILKYFLVRRPSKSPPLKELRA